VKEITGENVSNIANGVIRGIGYKIEKNKSKNTVKTLNNLWFQYNYTEFNRFDLQANKFIDIKLGNTVCCKCYTPSLLKEGYCNECYQMSEFKKCLFLQQDSFLGKGITCTKDDPPCNEFKNAEYCHSEHILYIGRLGNEEKVGISRAKRKGSYLQRFVEQGLNEVIVVRGFKSLQEVQSQEIELMKIGFVDKLSFVDKINNSTDNPPSSIIEYKNVLAKKYPDQKIEYWSIYDDIAIPPAKFELHPTSDEIKHIQGKIKHIQGSILIIETENEEYSVNLNSILHHQILNKHGDREVQ